MATPKTTFINLPVANLDKTVAFYKALGFTSKPRPDAEEKTGGLYALALENKAAVDEMMEAAVRAGGSGYLAARDTGFYYNRAFADLDGHVWEPFWMDPAAIPSN